jgi:hypothetical protein
MKCSSGSRKTANLSESINQRLNMYAIAVVVAVLSVVALPGGPRRRLSILPLTSNWANTPSTLTTMG